MSSSKAPAPLSRQEKHQISEKVLRYETFLSEKLKPDLQSVLEERDKLYQESAEFLALKNSILAIQKAQLKPGETLDTWVGFLETFFG